MPRPAPDHLSPAAVLPDDAGLTETGAFVPAAAARVLLIACGALAREIVDLRALNGWTHLEIACLPAKFHNTPDKIAPAARAMIETRGAEFDRIFLVYADCGTGGDLQRLCDETGAQMMRGPHCYAFYEGVDAAAARGDTDMRAFYLTDFLVRQFEACVWKPLGLDRHPELLPMYFGHYERLVYLAQVEDPALETRAQECAARMGLSYERRLTGYGELATDLARVADQAVPAAKPDQTS
ncbi:hypothetical protein DI396_04140 [Litorivita pollutaquae]|uniref:DUF1638 domain-containing protein n=1 Tax=Litorivita pollutaquae TaxID=2200892 RepID=A0A2V4ND84_9RHOB|nr:DUF1638 domain-containing protein [Litorivita pollutaquae]PYC48203.1 hypothetical protein DI396_04140 [Litorivita pollutaquae]